MGDKKVEEEVKSVLLSLHAKIDSLRAKVEALCDTTDGCTPPPTLKKKKDKNN